VLLTRGDRHSIDYANPCAQGLLGIDEVGARLMDVLPAAARAAVQAIADASFATGQRRVAKEIVLRQPTEGDGSWQYADVFASPVRDGAGQLAGLIFYLVDSSQSRGRVITR
jgi:PAS domain-containing protein